MSALAGGLPASAGRDPLVAERHLARRLPNGVHHGAAGFFRRRLLWVFVCVVDSRHLISKGSAELCCEWVVHLCRLAFYYEDPFSAPGDRAQD